MYKNFVGKNNHMLMVDFTKKEYHKIFTPPYDRDMLCQKCDCQIIGNNLENYASEMPLYKKTNNFLFNLKNENGVLYSYYENIDYQKFKLFLLSLIWRASISKQPIFKHVQLRDYEEQIRSMIIENMYPDENFIPCMIYTYENLDIIKEIKFATGPVKTRTQEGGTFYKFIIGNLLYLFFTSKKGVPEIAYNIALNKAGKMKVVLIDNKKTASEILRSFCPI
jgi:hypothetical protein